MEQIVDNSSIMNETNTSTIDVSFNADDKSMLNYNLAANNSKELSVTNIVENAASSLSFSITETERKQLQKHAVTSDHDTTVDVECDTIQQDELAACNQTEIAQDNMMTTLVQSSAEEQPTSEQQDTLIYDYNENHYFQNKLIELGRRCWISNSEKQHYTKGCLWSPDGTCLLVPVHLDGMHVLELPIDLYSVAEVNEQRTLSELPSAVHVPEGGTVYDYIWYPLMNSQDHVTCFWIATRQHEPIQIWDAFDGSFRGSYVGYDNADEVETAISLSFSNDGQKIYAGYKKSIKIFDTNRPGRIYDQLTAKCVSCITQPQDNKSTLTCGNWNGYIQQYDLRNIQLGPIRTFGRHNAGVTHLRYAVANYGADQYLFSGARQDNRILQWDIRNLTKPLHERKRNVGTNQRIYFDFSPNEQWLASGDTQGKLHIWHLSEPNSEDIALQLHDDCCNGVNFHPVHPILATSSGQYHFFDCPLIPEESSEEQELVINYENAVLLLWCGPMAKNT